jgi:hypothetical protein
MVAEMILGCVSKQVGDGVACFRGLFEFTLLNKCRLLPIFSLLASRYLRPSTTRYKGCSVHSIIQGQTDSFAGIKNASLVHIRG